MPPALPAPVSPRRNSDGSFSLARQLGLGVSRIVIDPGHGGHDPGAQAHRQREADLVLDIGLRLEALLHKEAGVEVVMTRRTDVFIPLEERTAIANRVGADLFLSIHANASRNPQARGIETYILNFASNPDAEAGAARENAASGRSMHQLPDIVRAIALNNKLDESRDFAGMVQGSLTRRLRADDGAIRDLKMRCEIASYQMTAEGRRRLSPPQYYESIDLMIHISGKGITPAKIDRAIYLSLNKYCSVYHSLRKDLAVNVKYEINSEN